MSNDDIDLAQLKERLAKLGVSFSSGPEEVKPAEVRHAWTADTAARSSYGVADLLQKVHAVEREYHSAGGANGASTSESPNAEFGRNARNKAFPKISIGLPLRKPHKPLSTRGGPEQQASPSAQEQHGMAGRLAGHATASAPVRAPPRHSTVGSLLAQYKEAQRNWTQEKAAMRREAVTQRKRANKLELELGKLERLHAHAQLDVQALKAALKARDTQLSEAQEKVKILEETLSRSQDVAAEKLGALTNERDDLKDLLMATLNRLESVDQGVARADESTALMEKKVRQMEEERIQALECAARAKAEVAELTDTRKRLQWQSKLLEKMSEVQLKHNKRKSDAIKQLLSKDNVQQHAANGAAGRGMGRQQDQLGDEQDDQMSTVTSTTGFTSNADDANALLDRLRKSLQRPS